MPPAPFLRVHLHVCLCVGCLLADLAQAASQRRRRDCLLDPQPSTADTLHNSFA